MDLGPRGNQNQEVFANPDKLKSSSGVTEYNFVRTSIWRKSDARRGVIDLEKPTTSGDALEAVNCSGFSNIANQNRRSQDGSCCISPENSSLAESGQLCRDWNSSRVSLGSVGSSNTPNCQSPIKTSNNESRHSLIDLNVPQEESLVTSSTWFHSSLTYPGIFSEKTREVSEKECGCGIGSMRGSSVTAITPTSVADCSNDVVAEPSVQRKGLFDLNVSLESSDMPSEIISNYRDEVANNGVSKGTTSNHSFSMKNSQQAETSTKFVVLENDHMSACEDDNNVLLPTPSNNGITKVQCPEYGTINNGILIPESPLVDLNVPIGFGISQNGASDHLELSMLDAKVNDDNTAASIAARTLLSIIQHNSVRTADCPGSSSQAAAQNGNDEPQPSLDSFEEIVLNLEEIKDDGRSMNAVPPDKEGPACGIKLKRGRAMRNFQREIMPRLVFLARQEVCEDLEAIGYEPKKTRSRKTRKDQGAPSARSRPPKRGAKN
ncbi:hypothetical protein BS78_01G291900 [Paspalum vaginatum]|nr:hypothetical protein BS78_01G291900 [Paspalum vaginatum]